MDAPMAAEGLSRSEIQYFIRSKIPKAPPQDVLDDAVFLEIQHFLRLHTSYEPWHKSPRLYCLLRMLCNQNSITDDAPILQSFADAALEDVCLPFRECYLPEAIKKDGSLLDSFYDLQTSVLSKAETMSSTNFLNVNTHRYLIHGNAFFEQMDVLGTGGSGSVERVRHQLTGILCARKTISRGANLEQQRRVLGEFSKELQALRRLRHRHLVRYIGMHLLPIGPCIMGLTPVRQLYRSPFLLSDPLPCRRNGSSYASSYFEFAIT
jgi:hypothetical protein